MVRNVRPFLCCSVLSLAAVSAEISLAEPSAEVFGQLPAVEQVLISPSGSHYAALMNVDGGPYLAVHEFSAPPEQETRFMELELRKNLDEKAIELHWLNEQTIGIVFMFDGVRFGVPAAETRLIAIKQDLSSGRVIPRPPEGGLFNTQYAHSILHLLPDDPKHILMALDRSGTGHELGVYRVNLNNGEAQTVLIGGRLVASYMSDLRGQVRLRHDIHEKKHQLFARRTKMGRWKQIAERPRNEEFAFIPVAFGNDPNILLVLAANDVGRDALFEYDLEERRLVRSLYSNSLVDVSGVHTDVYTGGALGAIYAIHYPTVHYLDEELTTIQKKLDLALPETNNSIGSFDRARSKFIVLATGPRHPGTYYVYDKELNELRAIATRYRRLEPEELRPVEPVEYEARDGLTIHGYLTRPAGDPPYPMVVLPHGGPTARDYQGFHYIAQFLASRGYAVLQPNFRGSTGYGAQFVSAGFGQWGLAMQDDLEDGTEAMIERGIADPARIAIVGWSYGGYAALIATVKTPDLFTCAVAGAGVTDIPRMLKEHLRYKFATKNPPNVGHLRKDRETLRDNSPINGLDAITVPILIVHGDKDLTVPVSHSKKMAAKLKRQKTPHRLVILEDGDHHLSLERNRIRFLRELETFLARYMTREVNRAPRHQR